jgi:membrane protein
MSFAVVLGTGVVMLASVLISAALGALGPNLDWVAPGRAWLWHSLNVAVSFAVVTLLFIMLYKVLPDAQVAWRDVWIGAVFASVLFSIGKTLIGWYASLTGTSSWGAAGSVAVILIWVYYSSLILLLGAEFTRAYALATRADVPPTDHPDRTGHLEGTDFPTTRSPAPFASP